MLGAAGHAGLDLGFLEVLDHLLDDLGQELVARRRPLGHHPHDLVVDLGMEGREGEVLELPLDGVHAEPVGQRRVDVERLGRLALLGRLLDVADRAHVVQPVGELDHQHPDVARHRDDHLADRLGLRRVAVLHLVELGDPVDEHGDLVAEVGAHLLERVRRVLDGVVEQGRDQGRLGHADVGQDRGDRERVGDVGVAALAGLAGVELLGDPVGALDQREVGLGVVGADRPEQRLELGILRLVALRAPIRARRLRMARGDGSRSAARSRAVDAARSRAAGRLLSVAMPRVYGPGPPWRLGTAQTVIRLVRGDLADGPTSGQEAQVHQHGHPVDVGAAALDQARGRRRRAAGGEHVVDQQHPVAGPQAVDVRLEGRLAVLQGVGLGCTSRRGSLPALRTGTNPARSASATGAARMNPRASIPTTWSTTDRPEASRPASASASTIVAKATGSASTGVMSLNTTPGSGKSGTSTTRRRRRSEASCAPGPVTSCRASTSACAPAAPFRSPSSA